MRKLLFVITSNYKFPNKSSYQVELCGIEERGQLEPQEFTAPS